MGDEDDRLALASQRLHHSEQPFDLLWSQHGGRFVEDKDLRVTVERLENLDTLAYPERKIFDDGIWINVQTILL